MAMKNEKFHVEMRKEGFFDGIFDNIEDIDIVDFSGNSNVWLEELDSCFNGDALPPPPSLTATALTSSSGDVGSRLTAEENQVCDDLKILNIPEDWLNNLLDDTNFNLDLPAISTTAVPENDYIAKDDALFRSTSPVSVLEQTNLNGSGIESGSRSSPSSASSNSITYVSPPLPPTPSIPSRARTKRSRPAGFPPRVNLSAELDKLPMKWPSFASADINDNDGVAVRKCMHCGIQKTPQWRAGPMGPKTLCNACGVRYKSGRLFPEYRPAASPTFVRSVHSNSHKKVVEMRIRACQKGANAMRKAASPALKNCDLVAYIRG